MIIEMHCHTAKYSSCSSVEAVDLVNRAVALGLQAIVLTDHHHLWSESELNELRSQTGAPGIFEILSGQEVSTSDYGHVLVFGATESISEGVALQEIHEQWPEAALIWAHPYRNGYEPPKERLMNPLFDAIEIFTSNYSVAESTRALKDWHELKFTATGGTDTHAVSYTAAYPTIFDHPVSSIEELVREIKEGRCRPYFKERPRAGTTDTKILEVTVGPKSSDERQEMVLKSFDSYDSYKSESHAQEVIQSINEHGFESDTYRVPSALGSDEDQLTLIEERVGGETLYDAIDSSSKEKAQEYLKLAAQWLANLHNMNLKVTPKTEFLEIEPDRLDYYLKDMREENHPHLERAVQVRAEVLRGEQELIRSRPEILTQSHGDYHLKNIFIGQDESDETYISVIDFGSSFQQPPAFDVGTFIAQHRNMFFHDVESAQKAPAQMFLDEYLRVADNPVSDFQNQVHLFIARTYLSILYYLVKVGQSDSENFWSILVEAEKNLAARSYQNTSKLDLQLKENA